MSYTKDMIHVHGIEFHYDHYENDTDTCVFKTRAFPGRPRFGTSPTWMVFELGYSGSGEGNYDFKNAQYLALFCEGSQTPLRRTESIYSVNNVLTFINDVYRDEIAENVARNDDGVAAVVKLLGN